MKKFYTKSKTIAAFMLMGTIISLPNISGAQGFMNNNGAKMNVASGTYLNIDGTFENQSSGAIRNLGTMEVSGNWTNNDANGVFDNGSGTVTSGTVILDGTSQTIGGSDATRFFNLTTSGTGSNNLKTLNVNASVGGYPAFAGASTGVLDLEDNVLVLNANTLSVNNKAIGGINSSGGGLVRSENNTAPYGTVQWNIDNGTGLYRVPFGTAANVPISFDYEVTTAGPDADNGYTIFSTYPTPTWNNLPLPTGVSAVQNDAGVDNSDNVVNRFWIIGERAWSAGSFPEIDYTFRYDNNAATDLARNAGSWGNLRPQRYNPYIAQNGLGGWGDWLYGPNSISGNAIEITIANEYNGGPYGGDYFDVWTLVDESNPLPIELLRFAASCSNSEVTVTWTTASETNNDFFTVQRSADGTNFEDVTIVDGAGNSNSIINYSAKDYNPYGGTSYYRLKQTDFDGSSKYSEVVAVSCADAVTDFTLVNAYDQGNGNMAVVFNAGNNELYVVTLFDARGRQITETTGKAYSGKNQISIPVGDLARGIYMVNLRNEFKSFGRRVMLN